MADTRREWRFGVAAAALVALGVALHLHKAVTAGERPSLILSNIIMAAAMLAHAWDLLGWRRALLFFSTCIVLSFGAETLSIATGLATPYHYTEVLGPRLGAVPYVIPLGWFTMMYASHTVVNYICEGGPISTKGGGPWILGLSVLTALVMTTWDLTTDPYMVLKAKAWVWDQPGPYFGIPFANFLSWVETCFMINVALRLTERGFPVPEKAHKTWFYALPLVTYGILGLPDVFIGFPIATRLLSPFTMGIPLLAAAARLKQTEVRK